MSLRIAALVPMRHESERIAGKNYRPFAGRPLYHHVIESLIKCPQISDIIINTDSSIIMKDAEHNFPQVKLIARPAYLCSGDVPMNEILLHDVSLIEADFYLQTHSTNPLLRSQTISKSIEYFLSHYPTHDSLFSVTRRQTRFWDERGRPINHDPATLLRTQDLPPIFEENSNIYIFNKNTLTARRNRLGERPLMFEINRIESWDIDEEFDFKVAEFLYLNR